MKRRFLKSSISFLSLVLLISAISCSIIAGAASTLIWPVPGHTTLSQGYSKGGHDGIDISDGSIGGADVVAAIGGTVTNKYTCTQNHQNYGDCGGFGTGLIIRGDDGRWYQYAHMQGGSIPSNIYVGVYVAAGTKIGKVGNTGYSTGNHLHFQINTTNAWNGSVNPQSETYGSPHTCSYSSSVTKAATCNATGVRTYSCSCGKSYTETIAKNASNHAGGTVIKNAVAATHTSTGYTGDTYCGGCSKLLKTGTTVPKVDETQWVYVTALPSHVTSEEYDIEYNNIYKKVATSSPGSGWTKGTLAKTEYVNDGGVYESDFQLSTSNTRVLKSYYYYHWCGSSTGNMVNYAYTDAYNHLDAYYETNAVIEERSVADSDDSRYTAYMLAWAHDPSGHCYCAPALTCDSSNSHTTRSCWWYKRYVYQNKKAVNYYNYSKESGWVENKDSSATTVELRYKIKPHECSYTATVTLSASCTQTGIKTYSCDCGNKYTEVIPVLGHDIIIDTAVAATCTKTGLTEGQHCLRCNDATVKQELVPMVEHSVAISKNDSINHWDECSCGEKLDVEGHNYGGDNVCDICKYEKVIAFKMSIRRPSITTISYGDSIILHADMNEALPDSWKIKWSADSGNFSFSSSADGSTCTITPNKSGDATFTVTVYDENNNVISEDTQKMTSKASFFDKFIAFFKKLFGMTKVIAQSIHTVY